MIPSECANSRLWKSAKSYVHVGKTCLVVYLFLQLSS